MWDEWNDKSPHAQADDSLSEDERLLESFEALSDVDRARVTFSFGPVTLGFEEAVAARLNEHTFHTWDIEVMFDGAARIPADAAAVIVDNLGLIARFTAKPTGDEREVRVRTSHPVRHFTVRLTPEEAELLAGDAGMTPDVELPAESFCRLVYGRLDPDHSPMVSANGEVLDLLRRVFPDRELRRRLISGPRVPRRPHWRANPVPGANPCPDAVLRRKDHEQDLEPLDWRVWSRRS